MYGRASATSTAACAAMTADALRRIDLAEPVLGVRLRDGPQGGQAPPADRRGPGPVLQRPRGPRESPQARGLVVAVAAGWRNLSVMLLYAPEIARFRSRHPPAPVRARGDARRSTIACLYDVPGSGSSSRPSLWGMALPHRRPQRPAAREIARLRAQQTWSGVSPDAARSAGPTTGAPVVLRPGLTGVLAEILLVVDWLSDRGREDRHSYPASWSWASARAAGRRHASARPCWLQIDALPAHPTRRRDLLHEQLQLTCWRKPSSTATQ